MKVDEIVAEASKLSEQERAAIASSLIHSLDSSHYWVSDNEVSARIRESEEDSSVMISLGELKAGVHTRGN